MNKKIVITGVVLIVVAIVLGAFAAHALKEVLDANQLTSFETGVRYQMYHGLGLLLIGLSAEKFSFSLTWIFGLMLFGVVLFSGSIYLLATQDVLGLSFRFLGPITPLGGVLLICAWSVLLIQLIKSKKQS